MKLDDFLQCFDLAAPFTELNETLLYSLQLGFRQGNFGCELLRFPVERGPAALNFLQFIRSVRKSKFFANLAFQLSSFGVCLAQLSLQVSYPLRERRDLIACNGSALLRPSSQFLVLPLFFI